MKLVDSSPRRRCHLRAVALATVCFVAAALQGCASAAPVSQSRPATVRLPAAPNVGGFTVGSEIVVRAIALLGIPYRFGGDGPDAFDCSGLVRYVHRELGIDVPRTAIEQYRAAVAVDMDHLEPGDLLFFRTQGDDVSHVAIYAGSGRFVHAPQTGRNIELREIGDGYYRARLVGAGRLFPK